MAPIEEQGALWRFRPDDQAWLMLKPAEKDAPLPAGRATIVSHPTGLTRYMSMRVARKKGDFPIYGHSTLRPEPARSFLLLRRQLVVEPPSPLPMGSFTE